MTVPINDLRGMTDDVAAKLRDKGLNDSDKLLAACRTPTDRKNLAADLGVAARDVLELANRADLNRISGIGGVYSDLIEHAGVDTVRELAQRNAENLHKKILEVNGEQDLTAQPPGEKMVSQWVATAKTLDRMIEY